MPPSCSFAASTAVRRLGRFEIVRLLGKGNQSEVYLAHDPHLDREVAIKTLHYMAPEKRAENIHTLLAEARTVSKLSHPNVVTLYDAGEHEGQPYLVFEYIDGPTLGQVLNQEGALPPTRAAEWAVQILDALAYAHAQGIVHRDVKPSNILIDPSGVARIMDFGVAGRIDANQAKRGYLMGTPGYMAPEYIVEESFGPRSDLFAFGLVLHEMLTGQPAVLGRDVQERMRRIVTEEIAAPSNYRDGIDERLDDIVAKALRKDPAQRYADALAMREALVSFLAADAAGAGGETGGHSTLDFLVRRMRMKSDFPALSESIRTINRIAASDKESVNKLANAILKDIALTTKLLKLVNSVTYSPLHNNGISTVSRAVVILGFDAVRSLALSLMLFETLQNKGQAQQLKDAFIRALFSGMLAREMAARAQIKDAEEAFICAMFHSLGSMLALFYFPEEAAEVARLVEHKGLDEQRAATQVLGLSYEELGIGIARRWGFPDRMVSSMRGLPSEKVRPGTTDTDRLRILAGFSNELAAVITTTTATERGQAMARLLGRFGECLPVNERQIAALVDKSLQDITHFAQVVNVNLKQSAFAQKARQWRQQAPAPGTAAVATESETQTALAATVLHEPVPVLDRATTLEGNVQRKTPEEAQSILTAGLQDIASSLVDDGVGVNDILRMILETMYSGMDFRHVLFAIRDGKSGRMTGKFGFGENIRELLKAFSFPMTGAEDVFLVALANNADVLISDIDDPKIACRIPEWYRRHVPAKTFVIFPLTIKGKAVGLIYADRPRAGEITIPEKELGLLKALRNQAVLAIKQSVQT